MLMKQPPIKCPACGAVVIEDPATLTHYVVMDDIKCGCGRIVIHANRVIL